MAFNLGEFLGRKPSQVFFDSFDISVKQGETPDFGDVDLTVAEYLDCLGPEWFFKEKPHDLLNAEAFLCRKDIICAQVLEDLVLSADLYQIIKVELRSVFLKNLASCHHIQGVKSTTCRDFLAN